MDVFHHWLSGICHCNLHRKAHIIGDKLRFQTINAKVTKLDVLTAVFIPFLMIKQSEQQLVDCAQDFNNHGCNGWLQHFLSSFKVSCNHCSLSIWILKPNPNLSFRGLPSQAFEYIKYNKGLMTEQDYPYTAMVSHQEIKVVNCFWYMFFIELRCVFLYVLLCKCVYFDHKWVCPMFNMLNKWNKKYKDWLYVLLH